MISKINIGFGKIIRQFSNKIPKAAVVLCGWGAKDGS